MSRLRGVILAVAVASVAGCGPAAPPPHPSYDPATRRLVRLDVDQNGDGRVDVRTYLDGNRPLRSEIDEAGSGRIDRWEYFDGAGQLARVGTSSTGDGIEDTWTHALTPDGERRVDLSTARDRRVDRREFYLGDDLIRAEDDVNGDGRPDKWETYESGVLRVVAFDTTYGAGRPDRRAVYDADGQFSHVEADLDGSGVFTRVESEGVR
ncbi:MAG: hypothetical protein Q8L86_07435 [Vicinamibacterales bacterium]|nr:hypothetical protein [Vicinamibacterales bacterium]